MKNFTKFDDNFMCINCGYPVDKLNYSSRDHCCNCLCSLHVDIMPGDRQNACKGILVPIDLEYTQNKGYVVVFRCDRCGKVHKNKIALDDNKETLAKIANKTYNYKDYTRR